MPHYLIGLRDMILGCSALTATIGIVLFLRVIGLVKEKWEEGTKLTWKQIITCWFWIFVIFGSILWAISTLNKVPL